MKIFYKAMVNIPVNCSLLDEYAGDAYLVQKKLKKCISKTEGDLGFQNVFRVLEIAASYDCGVVAQGSMEPVKKEGKWISQRTVKLTFTFKERETLNRFSVSLNELELEV